MKASKQVSTMTTAEVKGALAAMYHGEIHTHEDALLIVCQSYACIPEKFGHPVASAIYNKDTKWLSVNY